MRRTPHPDFSGERVRGRSAASGVEHIEPSRPCDCGGAGGLVGQARREAVGHRLGLEVGHQVAVPAGGGWCPSIQMSIGEYRWMLIIIDEY